MMDDVAKMGVLDHESVLFGASRDCILSYHNRVRTSIMTLDHINERFIHVLLDAFAENDSIVKQILPNASHPFTQVTQFVS